MSDELDKIFEAGIKAMQQYPEGTTLGEMFEMAARRGERWGLEWIADEARRHRYKPDVWAVMLETAAFLHPDWFIRDDLTGLDKYRPRRSAKIRTRRELVIWYAARDIESALRIVNSWRMEPDA